jgi:hypothetical protein
VEFISLVVQLHAAHVRAAISRLVFPVAALGVDVARELAAPAYVYFTCNAVALSFFGHLPALCEEVASEFWEMDSTADVSGLPPVLLLCSDHGKEAQMCVVRVPWQAFHGRRRHHS